jgi:tetratricopeptide (TPR) repeat protein
MEFDDDIESLIQSAVADALNGRFIEAESKLRGIIRLDHAYAPAHHNLGVALAEQGKIADAIESFQRAIQLKPRYVAAHLNLAGVLSTAGRKYDAVDNYRRVLEIEPESADGLNGLGLTMTELGRSGEGTVCIKQAIRLRPAMAEAHNNLGLALADLGRYPEAEAEYEQAIRLDPKYIEAHTNLGTAYSQQGRFQEAIASYQVALWLKPDAVSTHWNRSLAWLSQGNYEQGWPEYEWRWRRTKSSMRPFQQPAWDGSDLAGKTILLWSEQGLGDTLQFIRYATLIQQKGARVIAQVPPPLHLALANCPGIDMLLPEGADLPAFDVQIPLMSLPFRCGTTLATVPNRVPYLVPDQARTARWKQDLSGIPGLKIGIAWQGNPHHQWDRHRSIPLTVFAPLAKLPGISLLSLQRGPGAEQVVEARGRFPVIELERLVKAESDAAAWAEAAAIMANLDLVLSVDTATVHLAGAMGVRTWLAVAALSDWRWMTECDDSPWYPTLRLFRQRRHGDWAEVFARIAAEFRSFSPTR